jgi:flavin-dependent dehydrogenase
VTLSVSSKKQFVVLILGTGPAGCASALALQRAGLSQICLVSRPSRSQSRVGEAASPDVPYLLRAIGLSCDVGSFGHLPYYGNISVWGGPPTVGEFLERGLGNGWHLDRDAFDYWLLSSALEGGATLVRAEKIELVEWRSSFGWRFVLRANDSLKEISARTVIVATGRASVSSLGLGGRVRRIDKLIALAVTGPSDCPSDAIGYSLVEAVEFGWWYSAPLPGARRTFILMTDKSLVQSMSLFNRNRFLGLLDQASLLRPLISNAKRHLGSIRAFPAATQYRDCGIGRGWVMVGDALMALDPLASCGIGGALRDGIESAMVVAQQLGMESATGRAELALNYAYRANASLNRFLAERSATYRREVRWPNSEFWRTRHQLPPTEPGIGPFAAASYGCQGSPVATRSTPPLPS